MKGPATSPGRGRAEDGLVLVTVIWLLALLGGLATAMSLYATSTVSTLDVYAERLQAEAALEAGLNRAVASILLGPRRASGKGLITVAGARVAWSWLGETARIDINYAPGELLAGLFARLGVPSEEAERYASTIVGHRGLPPEQKRSGPGRSAGSDHSDETPAAIYAAAHRLDPRPDPHRPFVDVAQLGQAAGVPPGLMARAAPFLTTFSGVTTIDPRIAAPEVIEALPEMTRERLRTLMESRTGSGGSPSLDDVLGPSKVFASVEPASSIRLHVRAVLPDGLSAAAQIVVVTYPRDRQPFRVLSWDDEEPSRDPRPRAEEP